MQKSKGRKRLLALLLTASLVCSPAWSHVAFADEEPGPDPVTDYAVWIWDGWDSNITVEYAINGGAYKPVANADWAEGWAGAYQFSIADEVTEESIPTDILHIRVSTNSGKEFYRAEFNEWNLTEPDPEDPSKVSDLFNPEFESSASVVSVDNTYVSDEVGAVLSVDVNVAGPGKALSVAPGYLNGGRADIIEQSMRYIYAYAKSSPTDLKAAFAADLYTKFIMVDAFGTFGIDRPDSGAPDPDVISFGIEQLKDRITNPVADGSITAKNKAGSDVTINRYKATVNWGVSDMGPEADNPEWEGPKNGDPISAEYTFYQLSAESELLICTDWNDETASGTKYYIRDLSDVERFSEDDGDNGLLIVDNFSKVVVGGSGSVTTVVNETENFLNLTQDTRENHVLSDPKTDGFGVKIRVMKSTGSFVALHTGTTETKKYDGMGINGMSTDTIYETGDGMVAPLFVGETEMIISPLSAAGFDTAIVDVQLKDASMKDAVIIDKTDLDNVKVDFKSNFYDNVPLLVRYSDGTTKEITVERIGLVINYSYQIREESGNYQLGYDCYDRNGLNYTCDYDAGEQIIIYATYYHPSNYVTAGGDDDLSLMLTFGDGTTKVVGKKNAAHGVTDGHLSGAAYDAVDTTTFIIDFIPAAELLEDGKWGDMINHTNYKGGFHAMVVNGGYDDNETFGGVQIGNGAGVYWDGEINWF